MSSNFELNKGDNFIFCIDVSGSMMTSDCPGGMSRIEYLKEKVVSFATEASKYDSDGIDVITFGRKTQVFPNITAASASERISGLKANESMTDTAAALRLAWGRHLAYRDAGGKEQTVCFIATDGDPSDRQAVIDDLRYIASQQNGKGREFAVSFLTVGDIEDDLQEFLSQLDDELEARDKEGHEIDIVDVKPLKDVSFLDAFEGAVSD
jgi:Mg-chelatase subunit ChlD